MTGKAEQITAPIAYHAEGPVWVDQLYWVDMLAGDVI
jgi:sugar lactone lactonase YvrE